MVTKEEEEDTNEGNEEKVSRKPTYRYTKALGIHYLGFLIDLCLSFNQQMDYINIPFL